MSDKVRRAAAALAAAINSKRASIDNEDLFQVLGVPRDADRAAIKAAYLQAARSYHPDLLTSASLVHLRPAAEYVFRRVMEAQATLTDDGRRAAYLHELNRVPATQAAEVQRIVGAEMALREGLVALKRGDYPTAIARLAEALRLNPDEGEAIALHAWARFMAGRAALPDLLREFEQAVLRAPNNARAHYYLGMARKLAADPIGARSSFRRAVDLDPHFTEAREELGPDDDGGGPAAAAAGHPAQFLGDPPYWRGGYELTARRTTLSDDEVAMELDHHRSRRGH